jgi:hypothetical protein
MCTVSWLRTADGYILLCNRDERLDRAPALAPQVGTLRGVRHVAPRDPAGGGTWIGANEYAVTICLLNAYTDNSAIGEVSRGLLVQSLLASRSSLQAIAQVRRRDLSRFAPFTLLALDADNPARAAAWDGRYALAFPDAEGLCPLTSSSVDARRAIHVRRTEWRRRCAGTLGSLTDFHRSHEPDRSAWSVCMHREDAETVSFTQVAVSRDCVHMRYSPGSPCQSELTYVTTLQRRVAYGCIARTAGTLHAAG